jgi:hypothetical protein
MNFYILDSRLSSSTIQAHAMGLEEIPLKDGLEAQWHLILGDYSNISFPVIFKQAYGKKAEDILDTGWPSLYLISDRLKTVLEENNFTGWKIFTIKVLYKKGQEISGYHGFSITGRCGPIDYCKSEIIEKRLVPNGPLSKYYKGLSFELDKWDKSDFFLPEGNFGIKITQKVADALKKSKLTNIRLENISEIETDAFTVSIATQNRKKKKFSWFGL